MKPPVPALFAFLAFLSSIHAGTGSHTHGVEEPDWLTGERVSLGGVLFPHLHFSSVYGRTSLDDAEDLAAGHSDPYRDGWTVQGFELGLSGRFSEYVEGFATWHGSWKSEDPHHFTSEWEEYFLKFKSLPGGLELRGGQFFNRFGLHNANHLHAWEWADNYLVNGRLLGDLALATRGAELTWRPPLPWASALSLSWGKAVTDDHDEHCQGGVLSLFEAEGAAFADDFFTANWTSTWQVNDFHQLRGGLSAAWGDNLWHRRTHIFGTHLQYEWRRNGLEPGGDYFRLRTEVIWRETDALTGHLPGEDHEDEKDDDAPVPGSFSDWGLYTSAVYGHALRRGVLEAGLRFDYLDGVGSAGLPQRHRVSPVVTYYLNNLHTAFVRAQVNFDDIEDIGSEESVWLSVGWNWGGPEVR